MMQRAGKIALVTAGSRGIDNVPAEPGRELHNPGYDFKDAILPVAATWLWGRNADARQRRITAILEEAGFTRGDSHLAVRLPKSFIANLAGSANAETASLELESH